jgi:hypothetical protein
MINPIQPILSGLLSNEFSGYKYRKYTPEDMISLIRKKFDENHLAPDERHVFAFMKTAVKDMSQIGILTAISNAVLGEVL